MSTMTVILQWYFSMVKNGLALILIAWVLSFIYSILSALLERPRHTTTTSSTPITDKKPGPPEPQFERPPSCWICLEDGPDDETGKPLVRDCSCRGSDFGFAHLSCLVKYARQKCLQNGHRRNVENPWSTCPCCHQIYRNQLSVDMSNGCLSFIDETIPNDHRSIIEALSAKLGAYSKIQGGVLNSEQRGQVTETANRILRMVGHESKGPERVKSIRINAHMYLGKMIMSEGTRESAKQAAEYFKKSVSLSKAPDVHPIYVTLAEKQLSIAKSSYTECSESSPEDQMKRLKISRDVYAICVSKDGGGATDTINTGINLASRLQELYYTIEAERLLLKLAATSRRVHGPSHDLTMRVESCLKEAKMRIVISMTPSGKKVFQALRWEGGGKNCTIQGPIVWPRNEQEETTFTVPTKSFVPNNGCPVVCHGLKKAAHLNGKLGDLRKHHGEVNAENNRYEIHFEDTTLKPNVARVRPENVKLVLELPEK